MNWISLQIFVIRLKGKKRFEEVCPVIKTDNSS